jgi:hypothetical protein
MKALLFTSVLTACGTEPQNLRTQFAPQFQDEELKPYVEDVFYAAKERGVTIPQVRLSYLFSKPPLHPEMPRAVGLCAISKIGNNATITISVSYWQKASDIERSALIYHEVGHCVFRLGHYDQDPTSIMYPYVFREEWLQVMFDSMVDKMMDRIKRGG